MAEHAGDDRDPPMYGGSVCRDPACGWVCSDPAVQRCQRCGGWCSWWMTDIPSLIPPEVVAAYQASGEPLLPLPSGEDEGYGLH